jgi:copper transport protein
MTFPSALAAPAARRLATFAVMLVAFLVVAAPTAAAHAVLIETEPGFDRVVGRSPERVVLRFSEPVEIALGSIRVFDGGGARVDDGTVQHVDGASSVAVSLEDELPHGTYTTTWSVVSADSHPVRGAFVWHVGAPGARPEGIADEVLRTGTLEATLFGVTRWLAFGGLLLLAGSWWFAFFLWRPRRSLSATFGDADEVFRRRLWTIVATAWVVVAITTLAGILLQTATAAGVSLAEATEPNALGEVLRTRYGRAGLLRLGLLVVAVLVWIAWAKRPSAAAPSPVRGTSLGAAAVETAAAKWIVVAGTLCMLALLATPGLAGHAATADPAPLNLGADILHLSAAAAWIGGLVTMLAGAFPATASLGPVERTRVLAPVIARFSDAAVVAVAVLVVSGTYRSWVEIGTLASLTNTSYGLVLLGKVAAFVPLVILGTVNNRVLKPRIVAAANGGDASGAMRSLRRTIGAEVALAIVVVAITAVLVNLSPARSQAASTGPFVTDVRLGDDNLNVLVDPTQVGENIVHLTATDASGKPAQIKRMNVRFEQPARAIGPITARARRLAPGHFVVQGRQLSVAGEWRLEIVALVDRFTQQRATVEFEVGP